MTIKKIPSKVDFIINVAGPDQDYCKKNPSLSISKRLKINKDLEKIIKKKNVKKYFYISTIHVYKKKKLINENSQLNLNEPYARSHISSEVFVVSKIKKHCDILIMRVANCFGYPMTTKSNSWKLVVNNIAKNIHYKRSINITSEEDFYRDFIGIGILTKNLHYFLKNKNQNDIMNICSERPMLISNLCKKIKKTYEKIYKKKITIKSNFKKRGKYSKIYSKFKIKNLRINYKIVFQKELEDLLKYSYKNLKKIERNNNYKLS